jgi:hypothetical protein
VTVHQLELGPEQPDLREGTGGVPRGAYTRAVTRRGRHAARATPAFPAVGTTSRRASSSTARVTAAESPRALNEPVGFTPSSFTNRRSRP